MRTSALMALSTTILFWPTAGAAGPPGVDSLQAQFETYCTDYTHIACRNQATTPRLLKWRILGHHCLDEANHGTDLCRRYDDADFQRDNEPRVLAYDLRARTWRARDGLEDGRLEIDRTGVPRVLQASDEVLSVVVEHANPLLDRASIGEPKETDIDGLGALQTLFTSLGGTVSGLARAEERLAPVSGAVEGGGVSPPVPGVLARDTISVETPDREALRHEASGRFDEARRKVFAQVETLREQQTELRNRVDRLAAQKAHVIETALALEYGDNVVGRWVDPDLFTFDWNVAFGDLRQTLRALRPSPERALLAPYTSFTQQSPTDLPDLVAAAFGFVGIYRLLPDQSNQPTCPGPDGAANWAELLLQNVCKVIRLADILAGDGLNPAPEEGDADSAEASLRKRTQYLLERHLAAGRDILQPEATGLARLFDAVAAARTQGDAVVGQRDATLLAVRNLRIMADRLEWATYRGNNTPIDDTLYIADRQYETTWNKVATFPVTIARQSPYSTELPTEGPATVSSSYQIAHKSDSVVGVGFGLLFSGAESVTWKALKDPSDETRMAITRTDVQRLTGVPAVTFSYRWLQHLKPEKRRWFFLGRPAFEAGVGLDADQPTIFFGAAFEPMSFLRLGTGWAVQRVTRLDGQSEGDVVLSNDHIRTRDELSNDVYLSFTLAIDELPLFGR